MKILMIENQLAMLNHTFAARPCHNNNSGRVFHRSRSSLEDTVARHSLEDTVARHSLEDTVARRSLEDTVVLRRSLEDTVVLRRNQDRTVSRSISNLARMEACRLEAHLVSGCDGSRRKWILPKNHVP